MKLTPDELREIAERAEIRSELDGEDCTDIPRLLAHIAALEGEHVSPLAIDEKCVYTYIEYKGYRYRIDTAHRIFKDEVTGGERQ